MVVVVVVVVAAVIVVIVVVVVVVVVAVAVVVVVVAVVAVEVAVVVVVVVVAVAGVVVPPPPRRVTTCTKQISQFFPNFFFAPYRARVYLLECLIVLLRIKRFPRISFMQIECVSLFVKLLFSEVILDFRTFWNFGVNLFSRTIAPRCTY